MKFVLCLVLSALMCLACEAAPTLSFKPKPAQGENFAQEFKKAALHRLQVYKEAPKKHFDGLIKPEFKSEKAFLSGKPKYSHYKQFS